MNDISDLLLQKGDVISVVGSGGKTFFINHLIGKYKNTFNKILSCTTTKIYVPNKNCYDHMYIGKYNESIVHKIRNNNGVFVIGKEIKKNKIVSIDEYFINDFKSNFDLIFIESDGSKGKKLKWWNESEPVINPSTTKTIAILNADIINEDITEKTVHRYKLFKEHIPDKTKVDLDVIEQIILKKDGIFKNALGKKIIVFTNVKNQYEQNYIMQLKKKINCEIKIYILKKW